VYTPPAVIEPQPVPCTDQVTAVLLEPVTVALNVCCLLVMTEAVAGLTVTAMIGIKDTVTVAALLIVLSAWLVATTVQESAGSGIGAL